MKDLYTFDSSKEDALHTYDTVRKAYAAFFGEFQIPYLTAEASSGDIGGELSHEYHIPSSRGEDNLITCTSCSYVANEELAGIDHARARVASSGISLAAENLFNVGENSADSMHDLSQEWNGKYSVWQGISGDGLVHYEAIFPSEIESMDSSETALRKTELNRHALKKYAGDVVFISRDPTGKRSSRPKIPEVLDTSHPTSQPTIRRLYDYRIPQTFIDNYEGKSEPAFPETGSTSSIDDNVRFPSMDLIKAHTGDKCWKCNSGTLKTQNAIELGHTFYLGTRYSAPLMATFTPDPSLNLDTKVTSELLQASNSIASPITKEPSASFLQMGCHGIGVSRMIGAIAESLCDHKGLNWPRVMAPFEAVIIPTTGLDADAVAVYDLLSQGNSDRIDDPGIDALLDDREKSFGWKLMDADLIGYPVIVILGRKWHNDRECEVQCHRLDVRENIAERDLRAVVQRLLRRL